MIRRLLCRALGHDWNPAWFMAGKTIATRCDRCGRCHPALVVPPLGYPTQRRRVRSR